MSDPVSGVAQTSTIQQRQSQEQPAPQQAGELIIDRAPAPDNRVQLIASGGPGINAMTIADHALRGLSEKMPDFEELQVLSNRPGSRAAYAKRLQTLNNMQQQITEELSEETHVRDVDFEASVKMLAKMLEDGGDQALVSFAQGSSGQVSAQHNAALGRVQAMPGGGLPPPGVE